MEDDKSSASKYPVSVAVEYPERNSRSLAFLGLIFLKPLLLIPHLIVLGVLGMIAGLLMIINFIIVIFTARQNESIFNFLVGISRWNLRASAYFYGLTDKYPPFSFED